MAVPALKDKRYYLLPWVEVKFDGLGHAIGENAPLTGCYRRPLLIRPEPHWFAVIQSRGDKGWYFNDGRYYDNRRVGFSTAQEAMVAFDKILLEQGFRFLTEEQATRLETLL